MGVIGGSLSEEAKLRKIDLPQYTEWIKWERNSEKGQENQLIMQIEAPWWVRRTKSEFQIWVLIFAQGQLPQSQAPSVV